MRWVLRAIAVSTAVSLCSGEVQVIASGTLVHAFAELVPAFERSTGEKIVVEFGASVASARDSVQKRLERGHLADVVIVASSSMDRLVAEHRVVPEGRVDIAQSRIGAVVRAGARKPDISSIEALQRTLLGSSSIADSPSLSRVYLSADLLPRLGIIDAIKGKMRLIDDAEAGAAVARGEADIGFQQIS
jgi:molybdate transport system substrate-binding protein